MQSTMTKDLDWKDKTILVVEDEDLNYKLISLTLSRTGANLLWAKNGEECMDIIKQNHQDIDIILMDIQMPKMNGIETTKALRSSDNKMPVIMQSAFVSDYRGVKEFESLFNDYLSKPYKPRELVEMIEKYLN